MTRSQGLDHPERGPCVHPVPEERFPILTTGRLWTVVVVCRQKTWRKVWVMATKRSPSTGNAGVSRLAVAQRPNDDSNLADVVHAPSPRGSSNLPAVPARRSSRLGDKHPPPPQRLRGNSTSDRTENWA